MTHALIFHDRLTEARELRAIRPHVLTSHRTIASTTAPRGVFPAQVESLVQIATVLWVGVLAE